MRANGDGTDTGAAPSVGDAEGLVQVEVADVGTEASGTGDAHEGVEVGAVEVDLPSGVVHGGADVADGLLEHAVGRRIGDHQRGDRVGVLFELGVEVVEVDVAVVVAGHDHDPHPGHGGAGGVGAVGRCGDEAEVAPVVATAAVPGPDGEQSGELALRSGVGLQRHGVVAGHVGQPRLEVGQQAGVPLGVLGCRERVEVGEARVADRLHLGGGVELHGARAERDHGPVESEVGVGEAAEVPHHLGLAAVRVEHGVGAELRHADLLGGDRVRRRGVGRLDDIGRGVGHAEGRQHRGHHRPGSRSRRR